MTKLPLSIKTVLRWPALLCAIRTDGRLICRHDPALIYSDLMLTDVQISKTLSFWLRHRPDAAGLTLTSNGWADIDHVLAAFRHDGSEVTWEQLLAVVEANDKQRFEISGDGDLIRAR